MEKCPSETPTYCIAEGIISNSKQSKGGFSHGGDGMRDAKQGQHYMRNTPRSGFLLFGVGLLTPPKPLTVVGLQRRLWHVQETGHSRESQETTLHREILRRRSALVQNDKSCFCSFKLNHYLQLPCLFCKWPILSLPREGGSITLQKSLSDFWMFGHFSL